MWNKQNYTIKKSATSNFYALKGFQKCHFGAKAPLLDTLNDGRDTELITVGVVQVEPGLMGAAWEPVKNVPSPAALRIAELLSATLSTGFKQLFI